MMIQLSVNGAPRTLDVDPSMPLLWALRDNLGLTGTKYGCGKALCGACTVHLDGMAVRSCSIPVSAAVGRHVMTIEAMIGTVYQALRQAWLDLDVPQCGYCQPGQLMSATALLIKNRDPSDQEIDDGMTGNICRCATYGRIRAAVRRAAVSLRLEEAGA